MENGITKRKSAYERIRQITFFKESWVPKERTGIFKVSNAWLNLWNNMVEENVGIEKQNSKKGFEKNEHAWSVEGVLWVSPFQIVLPVHI